MMIPIYEDEVPSLTTEQMIEVDRAMVQDMRIELIQMMENAGRNLAHLAGVRFFDGSPRGKHVVVLAGTGGNGGGALVCARRLHTWGALVQVVVTHSPANFTPVPAHQLDIVQRMNVPVAGVDALTRLSSPELIVDGLIGYRLEGAPHGTVADLIRWANAQAAPILALDVPSGVDGTTGRVLDPAIRATAMMTLALPKIGLRTQQPRHRWANSTWPISVFPPLSTRSQPCHCMLGRCSPRVRFCASTRPIMSVASSSSGPTSAGFLWNRPRA